MSNILDSHFLPSMMKWEEEEDGGTGAGGEESVCGSEPMLFLGHQQHGSFLDAEMLNMLEMSQQQLPPQQMMLPSSASTQYTSFRQQEHTTLLNYNSFSASGHQHHPNNDPSAISFVSHNKATGGMQEYHHFGVGSATGDSIMFGGDSLQPAGAGGNGGGGLIGGERDTSSSVTSDSEHCSPDSFTSFESPPNTTSPYEETGYRVSSNIFYFQGGNANIENANNNNMGNANNNHFSHQEPQSYFQFSHSNSNNGNNYATSPLNSADTNTFPTASTMNIVNYAPPSASALIAAAAVANTIGQMHTANIVATNLSGNNGSGGSIVNSNGNGSTTSGKGTKTKEKRGRTSHNVIERRYRNNINGKITDLRSAMPLLSSGHGKSDIKLNKGKILQKATEYIHYLRRTQERLLDENRKLKNIVEILGGAEMLSKIEDSRNRAELSDPLVDPTSTPTAVSTSTPTPPAGTGPTKKTSSKKSAKEAASTTATGAASGTATTMTAVGATAANGFAPTISSNNMRALMLTMGVLFTFSHFLPVTLSTSSWENSGFHARTLSSYVPLVETVAFDSIFASAWFIFRCIAGFLCLWIAIWSPVDPFHSGNNKTILEKLKSSCDASLKAGQFSQARLLAISGLKLFGYKTPTSLLDLLGSIFFQGMRQVSHLLWFGLWIDRKIVKWRMQANSSQFATQLYQALLHIQLAHPNGFEEKYPNLVRIHTILSALNFIESQGSLCPVEMKVRVLASIAIQFRSMMGSKFTFINRHLIYLAINELYNAPLDDNNHEEQPVQNDDRRLVHQLVAPFSDNVPFFLNVSWETALSDRLCGYSSLVSPLTVLQELYQESIICRGFAQLTERNHAAALDSFRFVTNMNVVNKKIAWLSTFGTYFAHYHQDSSEKNHLSVDNLNYKHLIQILLHPIAFPGHCHATLYQTAKAMWFYRSGKVDTAKQYLEKASLSLHQINSFSMESFEIDNLPPLWKLIQFTCAVHLIELRLDILNAAENNNVNVREMIRDCQKDMSILRQFSKQSWNSHGSLLLLTYKASLRALSGGIETRTNAVYDKCLQLAEQQGNPFVRGLVMRYAAEFGFVNMESKFRKVQFLKLASQNFDVVGAFRQSQAVRQLLSTMATSLEH